MKKQGLVFLSCCIMLLWLTVFCSIKEDRRICPCYLHCFVKDAQKKDKVYLYLYSEDNVHKDSIIPGNEKVIKVKREGHGIFAISCPESPDRYVTKEGIRIRYGEECPELYMDFQQVHATGDEAFYKGELFKNFCVLTLKIKNKSIHVDGMFILGSVCGYGRDGNVLKGDFRKEIIPDEQGICQVRIPRQIDESLKLEVRVDNNERKLFALGKYISDGGYDWKQKNLGDCEVFIDMAVIGLSLDVIEWNKERSIVWVL